jgi:adenylate kinase
MRIAILGAPGSGKGTQAKLLSDRYRVPQISTGDLLREAAKDEKRLDQETRDVMQAGQLVSDEIVLELLEERLRRKDAKRGFIIDGYPRNIPQAQALDTLLGMLGRALQISIYVEVDDEVLVKRITGRVGCEDCGTIFNRHYSPPRVRGKCDNCDGKLVSRSDDNTRTVAVRIKVYHEETSPLINYYKAQHKLRTVPAMGNIDEIQQKICDIVDLEIRPLEVKTLETAAETLDEEVSTIIAGGQINRVIPTPESLAKKKRKAKAVSAKAASAARSATTSKKTARKKATSKKTGSRKTIVAKGTGKPTVNKSAAKKTVTKKAASKAAVEKRPVTKKTTSKRAPVTKKASTKKVARKTAPVRKTASKQAAVKKKAVKKKASKKVSKQAAVKKKASKKVSKQAATKKVTKKVAKKTTKKKVAAK